MMKTFNLPSGRMESETFPIRSRTARSLGSMTAATRPPELSIPRLRTILAPFDFSDASAALLRRLVTLAENSNATVHVLHVVEPLAESPAIGDTPLRLRARVAAARRQINEWVEKTFSTHVSITTTVRVGRAGDEILAQAHALNADLIVMSAHCRIGRDSGLLRSTAAGVVRQSPCPVLVVACNEVPEFLTEPDAVPLRTWKRILLPVDLSADLREVLAYATAIVRENGARLHILHVASHGTHRGTDARLTAWLPPELRWPSEYEATIWNNVPLLNAILHEVSAMK